MSKPRATPGPPPEPKPDDEVVVLCRNCQQPIRAYSVILKDRAVGKVKTTWDHTEDREDRCGTAFPGKRAQPPLLRISFGPFSGPHLVKQVGRTVELCDQRTCVWCRKEAME